jgi:hypothetical protein
MIENRIRDSRPLQVFQGSYARLDTAIADRIIYGTRDITGLLPSERQPTLIRVPTFQVTRNGIPIERP